MVTKRILLSTVFMSISFFHFMNAQTIDSLNCDKYFNRLENSQLKNLWSQAPFLKHNNSPILCEVCDIISANSYKNFIATLILNKKGIPVCIKTYHEIIQDSLINRIIELLYKIEFDPAITNKDTIMSHYTLIFNTQKCEIYRNMYAQTETKIIKDSISTTCIQCDSLYNRICPDNLIIFGHPEHMAQFPGGEKALMIFLRNHIEYPLTCKEKAIQGRVIVAVRFIRTKRQAFKSTRTQTPPTVFPRIAQHTAKAWMQSTLS